MQSFLTKTFSLLMASLCVQVLLGQPAFKVLHYTETSGYDHQTREASAAMFQALGKQYGFEVVDDSDGAGFDDQDSLNAFALVIFSNTSGDELLSIKQKQNLQAYVAQGGSLLGIHAASDTYRHSTANGQKTGSWDWYAETLGGSVQESPNHVNGTPGYNMRHLGEHASIVGIPNPWKKEEEYYYWEAGYYNKENIAVLEVEETIGPNGLANSYDQARPISWYRELASGARVFYTALGHAASNYSKDTLFRQHIAQALLWATGRTSLASSRALPKAGLHCYPSPCRDWLHLRLKASPAAPTTLELLGLDGRLYMRQTIQPAVSNARLSMAGYSAGSYILRLRQADQVLIRKVIKAD